MGQKTIALVDCNSFYCSCERIFRPDLEKKPVVVLSNNDGCAISRTDEAKKLGVKMGDPFFKIKHLCKSHGLIVFSSNFSLYTNISDRVMSCLKHYSPNVEVYSVDEAFLDLSGINELTQYAREIRQTVLIDVGIPVGIGIAPTKVLSKIANRIAKKSSKAGGVVNLMEKKFQDIGLSQVNIEDVWGIGRANSVKMNALGIKTAKDLRDFPNEKLIQSIFTKVGLQIKHELMGISCFEFNKAYEPKKEIMCSRTFGSSVDCLTHLKEAVSDYISDASKKLRAQGSLCQEVAVFARTNPFNQSEQYHLYESKKLAVPTLDTLKLIETAHELLERGFREGYEYKKAGVRLMNFYSSNEFQLSFLDSSDTAEVIRLMDTIDKINHKEGEIIVKSASCSLDNKSWSMNRNFKSPRFTTSWFDLPVFK